MRLVPMCFALAVSLIATCIGPMALGQTPVAYWQMEEGSGTTTADASGNGHTLNFIAGAAWNLGDVPPPPAVSGASITIANAGDYLQAADGWQGVTGTADRSVSAWIKTSDNDGGIVFWGTNANAKKFAFRTQNGNGPFDGVLRLEVNGGYAVGSTVVSDGQWHHVGMTWGNDADDNVRQTRLYVDGVREELSAVNGNGLNTAVGELVRIGTNRSTNHLNGLVDEVRIFAEVLSDAQMAALAGAVLSPADVYEGAIVADSPALYYRLGESSTGVVANSIGTLLEGNNGISTGNKDNGYGNGPVTGAASLLTSAPGNTAYRFDGAGDSDTVVDRIELAPHTAINDGDTPARTIELLFNADSTAGNQVLIEEGGSGNGLGMFIEDGDLVVGAWGGGQNSFVRTPIQAGQTYQGTLVFDQNQNSLAGFLDGKAFGAVYTPDAIPQHTNASGIGASSDTTLFSDGTTGTNNSNPFAGTIDEVALYEGSLTVEQVQTHFGATGNPMPAFSAYEQAVVADNPLAYFPASNHNEATSFVSSNGIGSAVEAFLRGKAPAGIDTDSRAASLVPTNSTPSIQFGGNGTSSGMDLPDHAQINTGGTNNKRSQDFWFQAADADGRQVLYEQGGSGKGMNAYIENGELVMRVWTNDRDWGDGTTYEKIIRTNIEAGQTYHAALVLDGRSGPEGTLTGYLDGKPFGQVGGVGDLTAHASDIGVGYAYGDTQFAGFENFTGNGVRFGGRIDDVALYNQSITAESIQSHVQAGTAAAVDFGEYGNAVLSLDPIAFYYAGGVNVANPGNTASGLGSVLDGRSRLNLEVAADPAANTAPLAPGGTAATRFSGNGLIGIPDHAKLNTGVVSQRGIALAFLTGDDVSSRQIVFEEGGTGNGMNIYIENDEVHLGMWGTGVPTTFLSESIAADTAYHVVLSFDADNDLFTGFLDGREFADPFTDPFASMPVHSGNVAFGGMWNDSLFPSGGVGGDGIFFTGVIDDLAIYNSALSKGDAGFLYRSYFVPEPSTLVLLLLGTMGAVLLRCRKRRVVQ